MARHVQARKGNPSARWSAALKVFLCLALTGPAIPQLAQVDSRLARSQSAVTELLQEAGYQVGIPTQRAKGSRDLRIHWRSAKATGGAPSAQEAQWIETTERKTPPPRQRSAEISRDQIIILFLDPAGVIRHWRAINDPRLVRGEFPDRNGRLHKHTFYRADVTFSVPFPDNVEVSEVHILSPGWDSQGRLQFSRLAALEAPRGGLQ